MSVTAGRPPDLTPRAVANLVCKLFPFKTVDESSVNQFDSYDDRNFYFCGNLDRETLEDESCNSSEFVFKLSNPLLASYEVTEGLNEIMCRINKKGFKCPWPLKGRRGNAIEKVPKSELVESQAGEVVCREEQIFCARVVVFVPGELMDKVDIKYLTPELLYNVGNYVGRMNAAMQVNCVVNVIPYSGKLSREKLLRILRFCGYSRKFSLQNLGT